MKATVHRSSITENDRADPIEWKRSSAPPSRPSGALPFPKLRWPLSLCHGAAPAP